MPGGKLPLLGIAALGVVVRRAIDGVSHDPSLMKPKPAENSLEGVALIQAPSPDTLESLRCAAGYKSTALASVGGKTSQQQVPNALNGRGICPIQGSQMLVARARQVPGSIDMHRARRGMEALEPARQYLCEPLPWNGQAPPLRNHTRHRSTAHCAPLFDDKTASQSLCGPVHVLEAVTVLRIVAGKPYSVIQHR